MLRINQFGHLDRWAVQDPDDDILLPRTLRFGMPIGGARFFAPYHGIPDFDDPSWEHLVATQQDHLKHGDSIFQKMSVEEGSRRQKYHFKFDGSPNYPWQYRAVISAQEFSQGIDGTCGLSYDLTVTRQPTCSHSHNMPYRSAVQMHFALKNENFNLTVGKKVIMDEQVYELGTMPFYPLPGNCPENVVLKTGNRTISITTLGADHVMLCTHDLTQVCIELIYGEKHGKSLAPRESHQLMCGLVVTHD